MMICDADFDELFPGNNKLEARAIQPLRHAQAFVLMPAAATFMAASQIFQSMVRIDSLMPWRPAKAPS